MGSNTFFPHYLLLFQNSLCNTKGAEEREQMVRDAPFSRAAKVSIQTLQRRAGAAAAAADHRSHVWQAERTQGSQHKRFLLYLQLSKADRCLVPLTPGVRILHP